MSHHVPPFGGRNADEQEDNSLVEEFAGRSVIRHMLCQHILILKVLVAHLTRQ